MNGLSANQMTELVGFLLLISIEIECAADQSRPFRRKKLKASPLIQVICVFDHGFYPSFPYQFKLQLESWNCLHVPICSKLLISVHFDCSFHFCRSAVSSNASSPTLTPTPAKQSRWLFMMFREGKKPLSSVPSSATASPSTSAPTILWQHCLQQNSCAWPSRWPKETSSPSSSTSSSHASSKAGRTRSWCSSPCGDSPGGRMNTGSCSHAWIPSSRRSSSIHRRFLCSNKEVCLHRSLS